MAETIIETALPAFRKTVLPGGVRVITESIPSVRSVSVGVWVFTGSRDEADAESGISHFIEHMVFKGTARRRMHHIAQRMEAVGGYLNAFTTKEYTCYYARGLDEHLARALDTVCDLILEPSFPERELVKEKDVVLEEMKMYEDTPEDLIFDRFEAAVFDGHEMGRPIIGRPETVQAFTRAQLLDYMDRHYTPDSTVVAVAGNVDHGRVVRLVEKAFATSRRGAGATSRTPVRDYAPKAVVETRPIQQAHLVVGAPSASAYDADRIALTVLNTIFGGGMSSRLNQNIRERYGFCYNVYSFFNMHADTGDFGVYMGTDASKVDRAKKLILREMEKLVEKPVGARALGQAKNQVKGAVMLGLESMSNRMMRIGRQELYYGRYFSLDEVIEEIDRVTEADLQRVAARQFDPARLSTVVLLPQNGKAGAIS